MGMPSVKASKGPPDYLMRFRTWHGNDGGDGKYTYSEDFKGVKELEDGLLAPLRRVDRLARLIALLNWLQRDGKPPMPSSGIHPQRINQAPHLSTGDVFNEHE